MQPEIDTKLPAKEHGAVSTRGRNQENVLETGSIRIGRIGGIGISIHFTFGLIIAWGAWQGWTVYKGVTGALYGVLYIAMLFGPILLHELGHSLQARAFGLHVQQVTLLPVGGLSQLEANPSYPWHELIIVLAGPITNLLAAIFLGSVLYLIQPFSLRGWMDDLLFLAPPGVLVILRYIFWTNVVLFFFNMVPAFPMDGGRVIRSALAIMTDYGRATRIAAWLGRLFALGLAAYWAISWVRDGAMPNLFLLLMAPVIYFGARHEEVQVLRRRALLRIEAGKICGPVENTIAPWDVVTDKWLNYLSRYDAVVPVITEERMVGLLTSRSARHAGGQGKELTAAHIMEVDFPAAQAQDTLWVVLRLMNEHHLPALPVIDDGVLIGIINIYRIKRAWRSKAQNNNRTPTTPSRRYS